MDNTNLLQMRLDELNSAILNYVDKKVHIIGFYNSDRLSSYLNEGKKNWSSIGLYEEETINFLHTKNNALFIIQKNGIEITRIQFKKVFEESLKLKHQNSTVMTTIKKDGYSDQYIVNTKTFSNLFNSKNELDDYLALTYKDVITF